MNIKDLPFVSNLAFRIVGLKDRRLFKLLKNSKEEKNSKKCIDFMAIRTMLFKQLKETPHDPCLLHNKAVLYAYKHQNDLAL